ncbi:HlyD family type I secretion periplasmic adaptor subunit [Sulfurimonas sp.]
MENKDTKKDVKQETQQEEVLMPKHTLNLPDTDSLKYAKVGMFVLFIVFIVGGLWAALAELDTGVPCPAQVVVASSKKVIQHLEGGIVKEIYVKDGQEVKKGEKLIMFDASKSKSELDSMLANYYEKVALRDRLLAETTDKDKIVFSKVLQNLAPEKRKEIENRQKDIFAHEMLYIKKQEISTTQKVASLKKQIDALKQNIAKRKLLLVSYQNEAKEQEELLKQNLVDKNKLVNAKRKINSIESDILNDEANIQKDLIAIQSAQNDLMLNKEKFYTDVNTQLSKAQTAVDDMKARMINLRDKLSRTVIKSPVNGVVMNLAYHTIGAVVAPGKPIMDIVPKNAKLIIEAKVSPQFIDYVKVGNKARLSFPAFSMNAQFSQNIDGKVIFVAADSTTDKQGVSYYQIKLEVDKEGKKVLKENNLKLLAGMPASATVIAGHQTMLEYLFKPMSIMLDKAFLEK